MNAQQLKNSVLQMAVQGKLVPQDPNDEPAKALLEKIKTEKAELVKQKKIKADKNPSHIFRGEDNLFYETIGTETKCIQDEIPFDIPDSWEWVRLWEIVTRLGDGIHGTPTYDDKGTYYFINGNNLSSGKIIIKKDTKKVSQEEYDKHKKELDKNTILISINGTIGNYAFYNNEPIILGKSACYFSLLGNIDKNFICLILNSKYFLTYAVNEATQTTIKNVSLKSMRSLLIPLPPLEEQKRIVEKVQSLQPLIAQYAEADTALQNLEKSFPENLKKSLLQWAVQGKLVPQDPNDEPAKALLEKIKAEKAELVKQKKIKTDKNPSHIFRGEDNLFYETVGTETKCIQDEIPFDIPDSWEWVRLGEIVYNHGQKTPDAQFSYIDIGSIDNINQKLNEQENILLPEKAPSRARKIVNKGDILYATVRPYLHNMCIIDKDFTYEPIASTGFAVLTCYKNIYNKFLFYYLLSPTFDSYANHNENSKGVAYPAINDTKLYKGLIPLPPLEEQKRITQKLETLKTLCTELEREQGENK